VAKTMKARGGVGLLLLRRLATASARERLPRAKRGPMDGTAAALAAVGAVRAPAAAGVPGRVPIAARVAPTPTTLAELEAALQAAAGAGRKAQAAVVSYMAARVGTPAPSAVWPRAPLTLVEGERQARTGDVDGVQAALATAKVRPTPTLQTTHATDALTAALLAEWPPGTAGGGP
jgi:hypothetical protein